MGILPLLIPSFPALRGCVGEFSSLLLRRLLLLPLVLVALPQERR